jgi:HSP20 family protein
MMNEMMTTIPSDMLRMLSRMERVFGHGPSGTQDEGTLAVDIYEESDHLVVEASVPGFQRDDIAIQLHQGLLSIVASRAAQKEGADYNRRYFRRERPVGAWTRRIALPGIVHDAEVDAELKDGVLTLYIPIPAAAKPRQISIRTENPSDRDGTAVTAANGGGWSGGAEHTATEPVGASRN